MIASPDISHIRDAPALSARENVAGFLACRRDQAGFLQHAVADHGDVFRLRLGGFPMIMVNHPDHVHHVLAANNTNYNKDNYLYRSIKPVLRDALAGSAGGEEWQAHRRLMQPTFQHSRIATLADDMAEEAAGLVRRWSGEADDGPAGAHGGGDGIVDATADATDLALRILLRSLFGTAGGADRALRRAFENDFVQLNTLMGNFLRFPLPPLNWPTPTRARLRALIGRLDGFVAHLIAARVPESDGAADPGTRADLLTLLLAAADESGSGLAPEQLAYEILGMLLAGYETSGTALAWIFHQLAEHPDVQERVHTEVVEALDGRAPRFADLARLPFTRMVIDEVLRLFTPAWQTMRHALADDEIGGYRIPEGSDIYINFMTMHRHPEFWPQPERFDPERFAPAAAAQRPRHVYQPFGSGPRHCIGKHLALAELQLVTATTVAAFRLEPPPDAATVGLRPLLLLQPDRPIRLRIQPRSTRLDAAAPVRTAVRG